MREIKFRGKRVDDGEWVYGGYWLNDTVTRQTPHIIDDDGYSSTVDHSSIGQYTGLKDKNGKEIYEGDIFITRTEVMAVVEWEKEGRFLGFTMVGERKIVYINREPAVEVIGNIYDNPELLKVS